MAVSALLRSLAAAHTVPPAPHVNPHPCTTLESSCLLGSSVTLSNKGHQRWPARWPSETRKDKTPHMLGGSLRSSNR